MKQAWILSMMLYCLATGMASAQTGMLSGNVMDSSSRKPLRLVSIHLSGQTSTAALTDSLGAYRFSGLSAGRYKMHVTSEGYRRLDTVIVFSDPVTSLTLNIFLSTLVHELEQVTVRARLYTITPRADGYLYRINGELPIAGERAPDLLRRLPGLQVSPDGDPSMNGSSRIKVIIDGKSSEFLAGSVREALGRLPAELVASVEVISHPSARYEAEGVDGVILITTRKPQQNAANGTVNATLSNRSIDIQTNALVRRGRWLFDGDAGYFYGDMPTQANLLRTDKTGTNNNLAQVFQTVSLRHSQNAGAGITVLPDSLSSASMNYRYGLYHDHGLQQVQNRSEGLFPDTSKRNTDNMLDRYTHSLTFSYNRRSKNRKREYTALLNLGRQFFQNPYEAVVTRTNLKDAYEESNNHFLTEGITFQFDASFALSAKAKIETGVRCKYSDYNNLNTISYSDPVTGGLVTDANRSSSFRDRGASAAGYFSYTLNLGKYVLRTGLRYEQTGLTLFVKDAPLNIPRYTNWLPNLMVSRTWAKHTFTASFAGRLQGPYLVWLNPVVYYIDSFNIERGNPYLRPVNIQVLTASYAARLNSITLNTAFVINHAKGNIEPVSHLLAGGAVEKTWENISSNTSYALSGGFNYQNAHWNINLNQTLSSYVFQAGAGIPSRSAWLLQNSALINYTFAKTWTLATYLTCNTNTPTLQGSVTGTRWYNLILVKKFKGDHLSAALRFDNFLTHYQYVTEQINAPTFTQSRETRNIYRFFRFNLSWKIGRKEIRLPASRRVIEN